MKPNSLLASSAQALLASFAGLETDSLSLGLVCGRLGEGLCLAQML